MKPKRGAFPPAERAPVVHRVKCWPDYFTATASGDKTFEFRQNDRGYRTGDFLVLHEWSPRTEAYTGQQLSFRIGYMLTEMGVPEGYCVFAIVPAEIPADLLARTPITERER